VDVSQALVVAEANAYQKLKSEQGDLIPYSCSFFAACNVQIFLSALFPTLMQFILPCGIVIGHVMEYMSQKSMATQVLGGTAK